MNANSFSRSSNGGEIRPEQVAFPTVARISADVNTKAPYHIAGFCRPRLLKSCYKSICGCIYKYRRECPTCPEHILDARALRCLDRLLPDNAGQLSELLGDDGTRRLSHHRELARYSSDRHRRAAVASICVSKVRREFN